jgi:DNA-directed RNA polymerase specialized sigma24 family protein
MTNDAEWQKQLCREDSEAIEQLHALCHETIYEFLSEHRPDLLDYTAGCAHVAVDVVIKELQRQESPPAAQSAPKPISSVSSLAQGCSIGEGSMSLIRLRDNHVISHVHYIALKASLALEIKYCRPSGEHADNASDTLERMMVNADRHVRVRRTLEGLIRAVAATLYKNLLRTEKSLPTGYYPENFDPRDKDLIVDWHDQSLDAISDALDAGIRRLSERDQTITELRLFSSLKSKEIGAQLKTRSGEPMTANYVNVQWKRIRMELRRFLEDNGVNFGATSVREHI